MNELITLQEVVLGIMLVLILVFLLIIAVLIYSFREFKIFSNQQTWKGLIDDQIMEVIVNGPGVPIKKDPAIQRWMRLGAFRRYFLGLLMESERKFAGTAVRSLFGIFQLYDLEREAYRLLRSNKPHLEARAIQALTVMEVREAMPEIKSKLTDKHPLVFQEAEYAMVRLEGFTGLSTFLDGLEHPISEWQQLRMLNSLTKIPTDGLSLLENWLHSSNKYVISFCLKIIRKFQLIQFHDQVQALLCHQDPKIQVEVVKTLLSIESDQTMTSLIQQFPALPQEVQYEILKGIGYAREMAYADFLKVQLQEYPQDQGRVFAAESLMAIGEQNYLETASQQAQQDEAYLLIINHALQRKL